MNYRNAKYLKNGWIDCEIEHPKYGWIPFTCNPDDTSAAFDAKELFDRMVKGTVSPYTPPTQEEIDALAMAELRFKRDQLLAASDILVLPDRWMKYTAEQQKAISDYRQALRDLPETTTDLTNVVWPIAPTI